MVDWLLWPFVLPNEPLDNQPIRGVFYLIYVGVIAYISWNLADNNTPLLWHAYFSLTLYVTRCLSLITDQQHQGFDIPLPILFAIVVVYVFVSRAVEIARFEFKDISS